jgi:hypothetical protein
MVNIILSSLEVIFVAVVNGFVGLNNKILLVSQDTMVVAC